MSNITQFFSTLENEGRTYRQVFVGPRSETWTSPPTTTEVEVHCWGGGGNSGDYAAGGGGGGGYVRHIYPVSGSTTFLITVGGSGGTSSVSCPSQAPTSPISATGGSTATNRFTSGPGAAGGTGAFSIASGISTSYTYVASGGAGGYSYYALPTFSTCGGGGAAGSPFGSGNPGQDGSANVNGGNGGGGQSIFGAASTWFYIGSFYIGEGGKGATNTTNSTEAYAFSGGGGGHYSTTAGNRSSSKGGICGGSGGSAYNVTTVGGLGLVLIYFNK